MPKLGKTIANVIRGDTRTVNLTFLEADGTTPIDLTGGTVYFTVNTSSDPSSDSSVSFQKTASSGFTAPTLGQHTFTLTHTDTNIDPGTYWYDAEFVDSQGGYLSSFRGKFIVQSDVTRT
jgi:hypothetical protein